MTNGLVNVHPRFGIHSYTFIHILVYSLGPATDNPVGPKLFHKHKYVYLPIPSMFDLINEILPIFTIPLGNLSSPCCKIGHGHPRVKIWIYVVQLHYPMFHAKFLILQKQIFIFILLSIATAAILVM